MDCPDIRTQSELVNRDTLIVYCPGGKGTKCESCFCNKQVAYYQAMNYRECLVSLGDGVPKTMVVDFNNRRTEIPAANILYDLCKGYNLKYAQSGYLGLCELIERIVVLQKNTLYGHIGYLYYCEYMSLEKIALEVGLMPAKVINGLNSFLDHVYSGLTGGDL